jgi:hypothetical protein
LIYAGWFPSNWIESVPLDASNETKMEEMTRQLQEEERDTVDSPAKQNIDDGQENVFGIDYSYLPSGDERRPPQVKFIITILKQIKLHMTLIK